MYGDGILKITAAHMEVPEVGLELTLDSPSPKVVHPALYGLLLKKHSLSV